MNKEQRQIKKRIEQAYSKLHVLSNITGTPYRDEIFDMNKKDKINLYLFMDLEDCMNRIKQKRKENND